MPRGDFGDEDRLSAADVLNCLPGHRIGEEPNEIAGVTRLQRLADFAFRLHPANTRPVSGARIDDHDWRLGGINLDPYRRNDLHEQIVHRTLQRPAVADKFSGKIEDMRRFLRGALDVLVASLPQRIEN